MLAGLLGGCAVLPSSGPTAREITSQSRSGLENTIGYRIVPINAAVISRLAVPEVQNIFGDDHLARDVDLLGPGDVLQISIFEVGASLYSNAGGSAGTALGLSASSAPPAAAGENLPLITVDRDGTVSIPYIGKLQASGRRPDELGQAIRTALKGKSQDPQVIVTLRQNVANTYVVLGQVKSPGRQGLTLAHEHLLDGIAAAGGPGDAIQDVEVRLTRGGRTMQIGLSELHADSPTNVLLMAQDRIELVAKPRTFLAFGATAKPSEVPFSTPSLNLAQAVARVGGPSDQQADPSAVFVFRYQKDSDAADRPLIYRLDLTSAQSYFLAQKFEMQSGDVIYIANAQSNLPTKLVQILSLIANPFYTAKVIAQ